MKYKIILLSLVALFVFSASGFAWEKSPTPKQGPVNSLEEMGKVLVDILKENDSNAYMNLFITKSEMAEALKKSRLTVTEQEDILKKMNNDSIQNNSKIKFRFFQSELEGVNWNSYKLVECDTQIRPNSPVENGQIKLRFKCGEQRFILSARKLLKTGNGWKLTRDILLVGKPGEQEIASRYMSIQDSLRADSAIKSQTAIIEMQIRRMADSLVEVARQDSIRKAEEIKKKKKKSK